MAGHSLQKKTGFRLLQLKINSLKTQLEGAQTMQRLQNSAQSIAASRSLIASRSMMMTRREAQKRNAPKIYLLSDNKRVGIQRL